MILKIRSDIGMLTGGHHVTSRLRKNQKGGCVSIVRRGDWDVSRKTSLEEKKLIEDISYLTDEHWRSVQRYVQKLRQLERMDAKAYTALVKADLVPAGVERNIEDIGIHCSFCGKHHSKVKKMIAGPWVYICDECIGLCDEILEEEFDDADGSKE